jgi:hypothetical protein
MFLGGNSPLPVPLLQHTVEHVPKLVEECGGPVPRMTCPVLGSRLAWLLVFVPIRAGERPRGNFPEPSVEVVKQRGRC